mmetsp:Transcript_97164/g.313780  ORF Transcript_97164/g.313780 Transcript_97164/m.313780 type:complete len:293 (+) Transcript_97164:409-1287(+)
MAGQAILEAPEKTSEPAHVAVWRHREPAMRAHPDYCRQQRLLREAAPLFSTALQVRWVMANAEGRFEEKPWVVDLEGQLTEVLPEQHGYQVVGVGDAVDRHWPVEELGKGRDEKGIANPGRCERVGSQHVEAQGLQCVHGQVAHCTTQRVAGHVNGAFILGAASTHAELVQQRCFHFRPDRVVALVDPATEAIWPCLRLGEAKLKVPLPVRTLGRDADASTYGDEAALLLLDGKACRVRTGAPPPGHVGEYHVLLALVRQVEPPDGPRHHVEARRRAETARDGAAVHLHRLP